MKKIAVIGSGGAGKSTFSLLLGKQLNLPVYHLDKLYWQPRWIKTPNEEWEKTLINLCKNECWIIDGNYKSTLDTRLDACDMVIFLDVNRYICIYRAIKRTLTSKHRRDMAEGCEERINLAFLKFLWDFPRTTRPIIVKKLNAISHKKVIIAKSGEQALMLCKNNLKHHSQLTN
jgi:adenylate kinase family enzyme